MRSRGYRSIGDREAGEGRDPGNLRTTPTHRSHRRRALVVGTRIDKSSALVGGLVICGGHWFLQDKTGLRLASHTVAFPPIFAFGADLLAVPE